ncbi:hypothetical protein UlMin_009857 [Ulmus minor]
MAAMALKLTITRGPREGETQEYQPRSKIRIGRVVRGNNLPIKDAGISTKHLAIEIESGKWVIRDLESSNGTFVNGERISPNVPSDLHDGDCIVIGERTSISVEIVDGDESQMRRNPRYGAEVVEIAESPSRGRHKRARVAESEIMEIDDDLGSDAKQGKDRVEEKQVLQVGTRRTRSSKNEKRGASCLVLEKIPESSGLEDGELKVEPKRRCAGQQRKKNSPPRLPQREVFVPDSLGDGSGVEMGSNESSEKEENGGNSGCKETSSDVEELPELENMKLEEWFEFLEVHLPKVIIKETERMIVDMGLKAEKVSGIIAQHRNGKSKVPAG